MFGSRLTVLEDTEEADDPGTGQQVLSRYPRWFKLAHLEAQQCDLAATMLNAAKGKKVEIKNVDG